MRGHDYNLRSRSAGNTPSTSNSGVNNNAVFLHRYPTRNRPAMPDVLLEDDSIHAMLERGTLARDFAYSMQALGFGDEPTTYKEARLRPDSDEWAEAEDIEWQALCSYNTFRWITYEEMYRINPNARVIPTRYVYTVKGNLIDTRQG